MSKLYLFLDYTMSIYKTTTILHIVLMHLMHILTTSRIILNSIYCNRGTRSSELPSTSRDDVSDDVSWLHGVIPILVLVSLYKCAKQGHFSNY